MPINGKQPPDCQRKPINYDRDTTLPAAVGILLFMAGRGGFFFFPRRDGAVVVFFDGTGRGGVFVFSLGPGRDGCFWLWHCFGGTGQNRYTVPPKPV